MYSYSEVRARFVACFSIKQVYVSVCKKCVYDVCVWGGEGIESDVSLSAAVLEYCV